MNYENVGKVHMFIILVCKNSVHLHFASFFLFFSVANFTSRTLNWVHLVQYHLVEWTLGRKGHLIEWTLGRKGHLVEWTLGRKGHLIEWTLGRMDI